MRRVARAVFGARGQIVVGVLMVASTSLQGWWWGLGPGTAAIFWLSVEALFFAAYGVFATALGYRATERVQAALEVDVNVCE